MKVEATASKKVDQWPEKDRSRSRLERKSQPGRELIHRRNQRRKTKKRERSSQASFNQELSGMSFIKNVRPNTSVKEEQVSDSDQKQEQDSSRICVNRLKQE
ncbi:hypothetical protein HanXRQr2_Chr17g0807901 [Helianthus annuus]|uniref:Uncharacterized protein n=1 Tax=Helianthus annuus TaxID=4232 RepID=A0A251RT41_HELAN|nr:hypothetical protein HanXRQr2_Chr17g0807901 [Helianthus annuus]KAJ0429500.1 hypothetical protein HanHA300_Chr17g0658121 [Helianthus annuus]KAJ0447892.1 hypothetical protein HanHA89_Chr17g0710551 [Helianthus annuus]KAJ0632790.1 hypothetical protein HanLR1_Chr17g0669161 [Helianthus annuus]KAJ0813600.1 hypothetical protein HanPSC8_Chr17g0775431 [Helianthus annuus]